MKAGLATEDVGAPAKERERYPPTERGIRVRVYPNAEQVPALVARGRVRAIVWNWCCDVFERARAQANNEDAHGLAIKCTRAALSDEVKRIRRDPAYRWLGDTLALWSCLQVVKQAFAARDRAFERGWGHPRRRGLRASAPMSFCIPYDGRKSDKHYVPNRRFHIPAIGVLKVRTGRGHMPEQMTRCPTVTVQRDACTRWWVSFGIEAPGGAQRWEADESGEPPTTAVPNDGGRVTGLDVGVRNWIVASDGRRWEAPARTREREAAERRRRNTQRGRAKARRKGERPGKCPTRRAERQAKQQRLAPDYAPDGWIGELRATAKAEKAAKKARSREHAALARAEKAKARAEAEREEGILVERKNRGGRDPSRKSRKVQHKGKSSGAGRRPARAKSADERRERCLRKRLSRRTRGSAGYERARHSVATHCARVAAHRADCVHKASHGLVTGSAALGVETLDVAAMARDWGGKHVLRAGLGALLHCIDYKALWRNTPLRACPQDYPSSMLCSTCGEVHRGLKRSQPAWTCPGCATHHDRDENAAVNIADYAASAWRAEGHQTSTTRTPRPQQSGETEAAHAARTPVERHERRGSAHQRAPARRASPGSGNVTDRHPACPEEGG